MRRALTRARYPAHCAGLEHAEHLADLHVLAVLAVDARQDAGGLGADLEVNLVGLQLHQRLAGGDCVAFVLQPARDARLDDGFSELRNDDVHVTDGDEDEASLDRLRQHHVRLAPRRRGIECLFDQHALVDRVPR